MKAWFKVKKKKIVVWLYDGELRLEVRYKNYFRDHPSVTPADLIVMVEEVVHQMRGVSGGPVVETEDEFD